MKVKNMNAVVVRFGWIVVVAVGFMTSGCASTKQFASEKVFEKKHFNRFGDSMKSAGGSIKKTFSGNQKGDVPPAVDAWYVDNKGRTIKFEVNGSPVIAEVLKVSQKGRLTDETSECWKKWYEAEQAFDAAGTSSLSNRAELAEVCEHFAVETLETDKQACLVLMNEAQQKVNAESNTLEKIESLDLGMKKAEMVAEQKTKLTETQEVWNFFHSTLAWLDTGIQNNAEGLTPDNYNCIVWIEEERLVAEAKVKAEAAEAKAKAEAAAEKAKTEADALAKAKAEAAGIDSSDKIKGAESQAGGFGGMFKKLSSHTKTGGISMPFSF